VAYMLGNSSGKIRADRTGATRAAKMWRLVYLSSGELDLAAKLGETGRKIMAGQAVRMPTLPADAGAGLGVFQHLHGGADGAAFAHRIEALVRRLHGTAGPAFVERLAALRAADPEGLAARLTGMVKGFAERSAPAGSDGQVSTLARNFGLLAAAGELAAELGVLPWPPGEATRAVEACLRAVLQRRGAGLGRAEDHAAIEQVRSFLERHGGARFQPIPTDPSAPPVRDRVGFRE
jgi:putative DNA primase/helicase